MAAAAAGLGGATHLGGRTQQRPGGAGSGRPAPPRARLLLRPQGPLLPEVPVISRSPRWCPRFSVILDRMSSPDCPARGWRCQLGAAQVDLVVCHHPHELKDLLPAGDEAGAKHVVDAEGLGWRGGRRGGELLLQLQIVQNEAVAVVGYAEAVRGLAIGSSSEVGADPGCQPGARVGAFRKERPIQRAKRGAQSSRGSDRDQSTKSCPRCRRPAWRRSAGAGALPDLPRSRCPSRLQSGHPFP